mgnify:CR=1 FL=1
MLNRVVLVGRLTRDPELRYTPNGVAVASFTLAVNRTFTNQHGEREADFINIVVWRRQAENVANYLKKGSLAGVDGRIQSRTYENNQGQRVFVTEVVADSVQFLEPRSAAQARDPFSDFGQQGGGFQNPNEQQIPAGAKDGFMDDDPFADDGQTIDISDDDLPF